MLFPAFVVYYSIKKYGLLNPKHGGRGCHPDVRPIRTRITNYLSNAFLFSAILNVVAAYLLDDNADLGSVLTFSGILIFFGVVLQAIQRSVKRKSLRDV
jgi:hypothetical protein